MTAAALNPADRKRGRFMLWLLVAAIAAAGLAAAALLTTGGQSSAVAVDEAMFPDLAATGANAATIAVESPTVTVTLVKQPDGKWTVKERDNYPANAEGVRALVLSLSELKLIERRTADPARQSALELTTGQGGNGHQVTISDANGAVLAALVAGKVATPARGSTPGTLFVRRAGEDQTWLARGGVAIPASIGATLDKSLFTLDKDRIKSASFAPRNLAAYTLSRPSIDVPDFTLDPIPDGKEPADAMTLSAPATAISGLVFEDVTKTGEVDTKDTSTATFTTFDGLVIKVAVVAGGPNEVLAIIEASVDEAQAAAAPPPAEGQAKIDPVAEAARINGIVKGWAFRLPSFVVSNLSPTLEMLVRDKAPAAPAPEDEALPGEPEAAPEEPQQ